MTYLSNIFLPFALLFSTFLIGQHQTSLPLAYNCRFTETEIQVDGKMDLTWNASEWSSSFIDIEGDTQPTPYLETKFKMLWSEKYLYVWTWMEEPHVWATLLDHDDIVYRDNDFEVFIDPDGDTHNYMEIEVNAHNTILDLFLPKPYREGGPLQMQWTAEGIISAVGIQGSLNDPHKKDTSWCVEMAIPFSALNAVPSIGDHWRMNFSRVQYESEINDNRYSKRKDSSNMFLPEHNWVWSPQWIINMHYPEKWGYIFFTDSKTQHEKKYPEDASARLALYELYYQQKKHFRKNGSYTSNIPETITVEGEAVKLIVDEIEKSSFLFKVAWKTHYVHLRHDGKIWLSDL